MAFKYYIDQFVMKMKNNKLSRNSTEYKVIYNIYLVNKLQIKGRYSIENYLDKFVYTFIS